MINWARELFWVPSEKEGVETQNSDRRHKQVTKHPGYSVKSYGNVFGPLATMGESLAAPNMSIYEKLRKVREISRYLCEQDPFLSKWLELTAVMTVGNGIIPKARVIDPRSGRELEEASEQILKAWEEWCEECSADSRLSFAEIEQTVVQSVARDGESIVRLCRGREFRHGLALQVIDPALLDHEQNFVNKETKNRVVMGVEIDKWAREVAFHIWNAYAFDKVIAKRRQLMRIDASDIIHVREDSTLAGSTRSLPWSYPSLKEAIRLHELVDDYAAAIKLAARTRLAMHVDDQDEEIDETEDDILDEETANRVARANPDPEFINTTQSQILEVAAGMRLEALNIQLPSQGFLDAVKIIAERVAAGLHISYTTLVSDGSKESYSTVRHNSQTEREVWSQRNAFLTRAFHGKVFKAWLRQAILSGKVVLPGTLVASNVEVSWQTRGYSSIDVQKDTRSWIMAIENGLLSRQMVCAMSGHDYKTILGQLAEERKWQRELGVYHPEVQDEMTALASAIEKET